MTREEAEQVYPGAAKAVHLYEVIPELIILLEEIRDMNLWSPEQFIADQCKCLEKRAMAGGDDEKKANEILAQISHPDFLRYVRAKFGCM